MAIRNTPDSDGINEINITPFVDIVLVLLIIFMISTPAMVMRGTKVNLPKVANSEDMSHVTLKVMITREGNLLLDNRPVTLDDVKRAFKKVSESQAAGDAILSADAAVSHGKVMEVADALRTMGVSQVGFATLGGTSAADQQKKKAATETNPQP